MRAALLPWSLVALETMLVSVQAGQMALCTIPSSPLAMVLVRATTPCLDTVYRGLAEVLRTEAKDPT